MGVDHDRLDIAVTEELRATRARKPIHPETREFSQTHSNPDPIVGLFSMEIQKVA
jgi:hypothetical protein